MKAESPLRKFEKSGVVTITDESLLKISPILLSHIPRADWFFFYSKNGVSSLFNQLNETQITELSQNVRWAAIGPRTAIELVACGVECSFTGQGVNQKITRDFLETSTANDTVLFIRALHSENTLFRMISRERKCDDLAVYDNQISEKTFPPFDIAVFTSSRNAMAYFAKNDPPKFGCVAIGQPTCDRLLQLGFEKDKIQMADETSEQGLADALERLILHLHDLQKFKK